MKNLLLFFMLAGLGIISSCSSSAYLRTTKSVEFTNTTFQPDHLSLEIEPNFVLTVFPEDAYLVDSVCSLMHLMSGNYERYSMSFSTTYLRPMTKGEQKVSERSLERKRAIRRLADIGALPTEAATAMLDLIFGETEGTEGFELGLDRKFSSQSNPFYLGDDHLSVFRLSFYNSSKSVKSLDLNSLLVISGNEQLIPFETVFLERAHRGNLAKVENAYRLNMSSRLVVPPGGKVVKYIAVPPLSNLDERISLKVLKNDGSMIHFNFEKEYSHQSKSVKYEGYYFTNGLSYSARSYYVLTTESGRTIPVENNSIYISQSNEDKYYSVYGVFFSKNKLYFGKKENFRFLDYPDHSVEIGFKRKK